MGYSNAWTNKLDDVECQVVADRVRREQLHADRKQDSRRYGKFMRKTKADHCRESISHGVNNAIAEVTLSKRRLAVAIDDERRILNNLPSRLETDS